MCVCVRMFVYVYACTRMFVCMCMCMCICLGGSKCSGGEVQRLSTYSAPKGCLCPTILNARDRDSVFHTAASLLNPADTTISCSREYANLLAVVLRPFSTPAHTHSIHTHGHRHNIHTHTQHTHTYGSTHTHTDPHTHIRTHKQHTYT